MNYYLVDYPNVNSEALHSIDKLTSNDVVYIYYDALTSKIPFSSMERIRRSNAEVRTINMGSAYFSNPLTVRIAATLGLFIGQSEENRVQLVSDRMSLNGLIEFRTAFCSDERLLFRTQIVPMQPLSEVQEDSNETSCEVDIEA